MSYLVKKMEEFDEKYGNMKIDYCNYTGLSKNEILNGYEDFEDWRKNVIFEIMEKHNCAYWRRIEKIDFQNFENTIMMYLSLSADRMIIKDGFYSDHKDEIDKYFEIDESDFIGW